jgi:hypothetical protein
MILLASKPVRGLRAHLPHLRRAEVGTAAPAVKSGEGLSAAVTMTAAHERGASSAVRSAAAMGLATTAAPAVRPTAAVLLTAAVAAGACECRGRDRHRGNAGSEKHPQHGLSPLERDKRSARRTVPTFKRMELAGYRTSLNAKCRADSESYD